MSEYTPTTELVKAIYINEIDRDIDECNAEFDRWLASVKADAFDEGRVAVVRRYITKTVKNPYRGEQA